MKANLLPLELDVDAGVSSGFQFQQAVGANRLPIELRVRGITSVGSRAITAFGFKVYDYDTSILSSHSSAVAKALVSRRLGGILARCPSSTAPTARWSEGWRRLLVQT